MAIMSGLRWIMVMRTRTNDVALLNVMMVALAASYLCRAPLRLQFSSFLYHLNPFFNNTKVCTTTP